MIDVESDALGEEVRSWDQIRVDCVHTNDILVSVVQTVGHIFSQIVINRFVDQNFIAVCDHNSKRSDIFDTVEDQPNNSQ